jgi:hypothetical protein
MKTYLLIIFFGSNTVTLLFENDSQIEQSDCAPLFVDRNFKVVNGPLSILLLIIK